MKYIFLILFSTLTVQLFAQERKLSLEMNYGITGNHFVRSYIEQEGKGNVLLAKKNFLGTVGQLQLNYHFPNNTTLSIGYAKETLEKERNYSNASSSFSVKNFSIRHTNNMYFLKHRRPFSDVFGYHFGAFYVRPEQQELDIYGLSNPRVIIEERDAPNQRLNELGLLAGFDFEKQIDTKFKAGLHLTGNYILTASTYEATYFTGSLAYTLK